jgi:uncharacterized lipoprotein
MVRLQTIRLATGLAALMITAGCQHRHQQCCPCSCTSAQPASTVPLSKPADLNTVPTEPALKIPSGNPM